MKTAEKIIMLSVILCFAAISPLQAEQQASAEVKDKFGDVSISVEASLVELNPDARTIIDSMTAKEKTSEVTASKILELLKDQKNGTVIARTRLAAGNNYKAEVSQQVKNYYKIIRSMKNGDGIENKDISYTCIESAIRFNVEAKAISEEKIFIDFSFVKIEPVISDDQTAPPAETKINNQSGLMLRPGVPMVASGCANGDIATYLIICANFEGKAK